MTAEQLIQKTPRHSGDYRFGWIFSFVVAIVFAPFVVIFQHSVPWLIAVPIILGAAVIFFLEWKATAKTSADTDIFESLPKGFAGIKSYEQLVALEIHPPRKVSKNQLPLFPAFPETTSINSVRILYDAHNKEISAVNCDRYSALLITYLLDNLDSATEKSLRAGLSRFGELGKGSSDIKMFVHDKTIREAIKADFRGNLVTLIAKGGEKVVKDLLKVVDSIEKEKAANADKEKNATAFKLQ
jgi:hypothetical protein